MKKILQKENYEKKYVIISFNFIESISLFKPYKAIISYII